MTFKTFFILLLIFLFFSNCEKDKNSNTEIDISSDYIPINKLPQFVIQTFGKAIQDEPKIPANLDFLVDGELKESYRIGIEFRGSSSQSFDKKSYGIETWNENNEDIDVSLGGFPEEEDWILYGPYSDKSLIRNVLIFELSNLIGRYGSKTAFYELIINGKFLGTYVLMEKIKRDKNRVDISKNEESDVSGGYILKIDKPTGEVYFNTSNSFISKYDHRGGPSNASKIKFLYSYPKPEDINSNQKNYIQNYMDNFEKALVSEQFKDPNTGYSKYIDVDSFIDFLILNEITKNVDGYRISTYLNKDKNNKLKMGPIWDFNLGFGNANYCGGEKTSGWAFDFNNICPEDGLKVPFWWKRFFEDPVFIIKLKNRWADLRLSEFSNTNIINIIKEKTDYLIENNASQRNFDTWSILSKYIWPNFFIGDTFIEEIDYLTNWIEDRLIWMDSTIDSL